MIDIDIISKVAKKHNATLISNACPNKRFKLHLKCKHNHDMYFTFQALKNVKILCKECVRNEKFEVLNTFCTQKGGVLLNSEYINEISPIQITCKNNHTFTSCWSYIFRNQWCKFCAGKKIFEPFKQIAKIASDKGGELLSKESDFVKEFTSKDYLKFRCKFNHEFSSIAASIMNSNSWCPICSKSLSERKVRLWFEKIFNNKFENVKNLNWLKDPISNRNLELDGFNKESNIAFEFNGKQHYEEVNFKSGNVFMNFYDKTDLKLKLCKENNVKLFIIPYFRMNELKLCIEEQSKELDIKLPDDFHSISINENEAYYNTDANQIAINKTKSLLEKIGLTLISTVFAGQKQKLDIICSFCKKEYRHTPEQIRMKVKLNTLCKCQRLKK